MGTGVSGEVRLDLAWSPPGPVAARFMASTAMVQIINGPIGSGKTTAALMKAIVLARRQAPSRRHRAHNARGELVPVRRFKLAVVRDTYRQLWKTTLPSWFRRVPKEIGTFAGAENAPASHRIAFELGTGTLDSTIVDFHADFAAIGENAVEDFMRGYEPTVWYLNELDLLAQPVLAFAQDRAGRFPEMDDGGPTFRGVLADCNAPEFESWLFTDPERGEDGRPKPGIFTMTAAERAALNVDLFVQPGGRDPGAENLRNLPAGYYTPKVGQNAAYIARMIDNKSGYSQAGKPVHPEFNASRHVPPGEIEPIPGLPIIIGLDPRTYPSAIILQRLANGQRRILDELQAEQNVGPRRFGKMLAQLLHDRYPFLRPEQVRGICDPSAQYGADKAAGEQDWLQIVSAVAGIRIDPAPSNNLDIRREALKKPLSDSVEDAKPAILISSRCPTLISGLASGFRFRKLNVPGATKYAEEVEKNHYADICEAAEYACLGDSADLEIRERKGYDAAHIAALARQAVTDWSPIG